jgi:hypothetical protein
MTLYSRAETNAQSLIVLNTTEKNSVDKYDWDDTLIVDGDSTVVGAQGYATAARKTVFIDDVEATLDENRQRGLTAPGWWEYMTYTDSDGNTRHKAQHLVAFKDAPVNAADLDDKVAADVASAVTISVQPANSTSVTGAGSFTLTTTTTGTPGALTYVWQRQTANGTTWKNVTASLDSGITYAGFTSATLTYSGLASASRDGYKYRVKITSAGGTEEVISNGAATLTFGT